MANQDKKALYRLTYRVDGKVCFAEMFAKGERLRNLFTPFKEAHIFEGWQNVPERMPAEELTIDGVFSPMSFKLTYTVGGETVSETELPYGAPIEALTLPARDGYAFSGWEGLPETMPAEDLTVVGRYLRDSYRLTYVIGGKHRFTVHLPYGAKIEPLESPVKPEHVFSGWENLPETMPDADIVVNGSFEMKTFRLTRIVDGEVFMAEDLPIGAKVDKKVKPVKPGFYFSGWRKLPDTMPDHDITAITSMYPVRYRVDYEIDGEAWRTSYVPYTSEFIPEMPEEREGYSFGWLDAPETMPMQDIVVHGAYTECAPEAEPELEPAATYALRFLLDGELLLEVALTEGEAIVAPEAPEKEGYTFSGFGEVPETMPAEELVLDGSYTANEYTLSFMANGELISRESLTFGAPIAAPELAPREGYTFSGWLGLPETMPASDLVVEGGYTANLYTARFVIDGETVFEEKLPFGAAITVPEAETRLGYTFSGFGDVPETAPASDLTFEGSYALNSYLVTFSVDGETVSSEMLPFGAEIVAPEAPEKKGYRFLGFGEVLATVPAEDSVFVGAYEQILYTLTASVEGETVYEASLAAESAFALPEMPLREGYAFAWDTASGEMPYGDLALSGKYTALDFTLTFLLDGETAASLSLPFGAEIVAPEAPEKAGYRFLGWQDLPETMPAADLTLEGGYERVLYTLTFAIDGETVSQCETAVGAAITAPDAEAREGYAFAWAEIPEVMPAADLTLEGAYTLESYTLTVSVDGETLSSRTLAFGEAIELPEMPEREGFRFGWSAHPSAMPASDLTVEGLYGAEIYTVSYSIEGETVYSLALPFGAAITAPEAPEKKGYRFLGWKDLPETMPASDLAVEGAYEAETVRVSFVLDGETVAVCELPAGEPVIVPAMPLREGYAFAWAELPEVMPDADLTVTGAYTAELKKLVCTVDGEVVLEREIACGDELVLPEAAEREGYAFAWSEAPSVMPASDLVVEGVYTPVLYTLTFAVDGETVRSEEVAFGAEISAPASPYKEGFTFSGFGAIPETMPASDLLCNATFARNSYRFTVIAGGETLLDSAVEYGEAISLPEAPEREGRDFNGWGDIPETMPAHDLTIASDYTARTYRLVFVLDGVTVSDTETSYGAPILAPLTEIGEGREFGGWGELPATMPASDLTVRAESKPITYHLTYLLNGEAVLEADVAFGDALPAPEIAAEEGYEFSGYEIPETMPAEDLILSATKTPRLYRLTVKLDGEVLSSDEVAYGAELAELAIPEKEGYTFSGWSGMPETMPAFDLTVEGSFDAELYRVRFTVDGETVAESMLAAGAEIEIPNIPEREGYSFSGFGEIPAAMPAEELCFEASYAVRSYRLAFLLDGELISESEVAFGEAISAPGLTLDEGKSFAGWGLIPETMPASDLEFTGETVSTRSFSLRFLHNGKTVAEITCADGIAILPPELPSPYFWLDLPEVMPAEDRTVVSARLADPEYTVRFYDGKLLYAEARAPEGYPIAIPDAPEHEGYTFKGWSNFTDVMPEYDFDAVAIFEANEHTVSYIVMGEELARITVRYGEELVPPAAPELLDGDFVEWIDLPETMPDADLVIEARYTTPEYHVTYRIDGEVYYETDVALGRVLPWLNPPTKRGMTFEGWTNYSRTMPAYPIVISGRYVPTVRTLTYLSGGAVLAKREYRVGDPIAPIDGRNPLLGEFEGWFDLPAVMPDEDVTAVARYRAKTYVITYLLDGKPVASQTLAAGDPIKAPVAPARENAIFREWVDLPEVMPDNDIIVSGVYDPTVYTVTYRADGEVLASELYPIGARIKPIAAPAREHERFVAWRNFTEVMPAYDFTVDAVYEPNLCSYSFVVDGEVLLSGILRAGDALLAPIPAEKVGLDFAGFDGYDGVMPSEDVVYVGRYEPKTYHIYYIVDGSILRTDDYREGDAVDLGVEAPILPLGYEFSGWSAIPSVMPNHDVDVTGTTSPQSFKLTVVANERVVAEKMIPTNALISRYSAPRRHGYIFRGWEGLPEFMPPSDITVNGAYEPCEPEYVFSTLSGASAESRSCKAYYAPEKGKRVMKRGLYSNTVWISGDRVEMVSGGRSYAADISAFVCDGEITDRTGLTRAIAALAAMQSPKVTSYHLVVDNRRSVDGLFEVAMSDEKEIENLIGDRMLSDVEDISMPKFSYKVVSADEAEGTLQIAASVVDEEFFRTVYEVCRAAGLAVREPVTPQMSMVEYMQTRDIHGKGGSLVEILTGGYILFAVYVNGKIVCSFKNAVPFDLEYDGYQSEIETALARISEFLEEEDVTATVSNVFYGGFRIDGMKKLVKLTRKLAKSANKSARCGLSAKFAKKPAGLEIAYPFVKRRKKVKYPNDPAKNAKK